MLLTGFYGLLRLGKLTIANTLMKHTTRKLTLRHTPLMECNRFSFTLPSHKANHFYASNTIMIMNLPHYPLDPLYHLHHYIVPHDHTFPLLPSLWLTSTGHSLTYSWFISRLQSLLGCNVAGHSLH
ncbi:hypothetical protein M422DRAFT_159602 [Sphaerobolus stellatus SS14]|nr:hypothetical protein M422DRAFT_159602 [Sphaerobolus stellatus SS14]